MNLINKIKKIFNGLIFTLQKKKIDFVIVGAQKSGTTALDMFCREHPQISMAFKKETHFFDQDNLLKKIFRDVIYHSKFKIVAPEILVGETTPIYSFWPNCIKKIYEYNRDIKIIMVLRDPTTRAYSNWNMEFQRGNEQLSFSESIKNDIKNINTQLYIPNRITSYVARGMYASQILNILRYFKKENVLFLKYEELRVDPNLQLDRVWDFLGVDKIKIHNREIHARSYDKNLSIDDIKFLSTIFMDDITKVEYLLDWDCSDWRSTKNDNQ